MDPDKMVPGQPLRKSKTPNTKTRQLRRKCAEKTCRRQRYKNGYCAQHFRQFSGFSTVNFDAVSKGGKFDHKTMKDMNQVHAMTLRINKMGKKKKVMTMSSLTARSKRAKDGSKMDLMAQAKQYQRQEALKKKNAALKVQVTPVEVVKSRSQQSPFMDINTPPEPELSLDDSRFEVGQEIEVLRSSGAWQNGIINNISSRCFSVQFTTAEGFGGNKEIPFSVATQMLRKKVKPKVVITTPPPKEEIKNENSTGVEALEKMVTELKVECDSLQTKIKEHTTNEEYVNAGTVQIQWKSKNKELKTKTTELMRLKKKIEEAKQKDLECKLQDRETKQKIKTTTGVEALEEKITQLKAERDALKIEMTQHIKNEEFFKAGTVQTQLKVKQTQLEAKTAELTKLKQTIEETKQKDLQVKQNENTTGCEVLEKMIAQLEVECDTLNTEMNEFITKEEFVNAGTVQTKLKSKKKELEAKISELAKSKKKIEVTKQQDFESTSRVEALKETIAQLKVECNTLQTELKECITHQEFVKAGNTQTKLKSKKKELETKTLELEKLTPDISKKPKKCDNGSAPLSGRDLKEFVKVTKAKLSEEKTYQSQKHQEFVRVLSRGEWINRNQTLQLFSNGYFLMVSHDEDVYNVTVGRWSVSAESEKNVNLVLNEECWLQEEEDDSGQDKRVSKGAPKSGTMRFAINGEMPELTEDEGDYSDEFERPVLQLLGKDIDQTFESSDRSLDPFDPEVELSQQ